MIIVLIIVVLLVAALILYFFPLKLPKRISMRKQKFDVLQNRLYEREITSTHCVARSK